MLLRTRIIVFVLLVVSGVAGLVFMVGTLREQELEHRITELQLQQLEQAWNFAVNRTADEVAERLMSQAALSEILFINAIRREDQQELARMAETTFSAGGFLRIDILGDNGQLLWASGDGLDQLPLLGAGLMAQMRQDDRTISGARAMPGGGIGVVGAVAVLDPSTQRMVGGIAAAVPLTQALEAFQQGTGGRLYASDIEGQLVFGRYDGLWRQALDASAPNRRGLTVIHYEGLYQEVALLPIPDMMGGRLATLLLVRDVTKAVESRMLWDKALAGAIVLVFVAAMLLLYFYLRRNFAVLNDAVAALHDLSQGHRGGYVELPHGSDEIGRIAEAVEAFGEAVGEVARAGVQRERRQRRQQRFIRRQMEQLAATLQDEARSELLNELSQMETAASDPQSVQSKGVGDELGLIALGFSRLATKVSVQQVQLTQLVRDLREALEDKRKLISLQQELEIAASMQLSILPRHFPDLPMLDMIASMDPAKEVGGDFYDIFAVRDGVLGVVVADVSGKGIPAAFFMLISRTMLRTVAVGGGGPADTLSRLNNLLAAENEQTMFVTVFYAEIELATGVITYCSGGHNPPYVVRAGGGVEVVVPTVGLALAAFSDMPYSEKTLTLSRGDSLFMYTDGVNEAFALNDTMYGVDRLQQTLAAGGPPPSAAVALERVMSDLSVFTQGAAQSDDITAMVVHWKG
jgi:phosphoserine phosphatase RsbU/P